MRRNPDAIDPGEVTYIANICGLMRRMRQAQIRVINVISLDELERAAEFMRLNTLDPGESEVLAVAGRRRYIAVLDELAAHCIAEANELPHTSTLGILVNAVRADRLDIQEGEPLWTEMQRGWDYAPPGNLQAYASGSRPVWRPCPR